MWQWMSFQRATCGLRVENIVSDARRVCVRVTFPLNTSPAMRALIVAEKPSIVRAIVELVSPGARKVRLKAEIAVDSRCAA